MTEAEWLTCADPDPMVEWVRSKASERKLRLFACACCQRLGRQRLLPDADSRTAVEVAERYADGLVPKKALAAARSEAYRVVKAQRGRRGVNTGAYHAWCATRENLRAAIVSLAGGAAWTASYRRSPSGLLTASGEDVERHQAALADLVRDVFGNPFRKPPAVSPTVLTWNDGAVVKMAQATYDGRGFNRLPILADALEDAGCDDRTILEHCRGSGRHVRGCWLVDAILGLK